jgi:Arc/MetJ family transcription regulator
MGIMKTTADIPEDELQEAVRHAGAKTKREAIVTALRDYNHRRRLARLAEAFGTLERFMTQDDLRRMRKDSRRPRASRRP